MKLFWTAERSKQLHDPHHEPTNLYNWGKEASRPTVRIVQLLASLHRAKTTEFHLFFQRSLCKVKIFPKKDQEVQESTRKILGFVKESFTLQNFRLILCRIKTAARIHRSLSFSHSLLPELRVTTLLQVISYGNETIG